MPSSHNICSATRWVRLKSLAHFFTNRSARWWGSTVEHFVLLNYDLCYKRCIQGGIVAEEQNTKWVLCARCGYRKTDHRILYENGKDIYEEAPPGFPDHIEYHRLVECMGCKTIKYVVSDVTYESDDLPEWEKVETNLKIFPDGLGTNRQRAPAITQDQASDENQKLLIPVSVWKMYKETIDALNANIRTLAGGGLRATVEAICLDKNIRNGILQNKIDELVEQNLLTRTQADLLHEERYLGNAALHELATPSAQDIEDGLGIVEGLINTIYILPFKAKRLKERREAGSTR